MLDVRCWMLVGSDGEGSTNIQHPKSNIRFSDLHPHHLLISLNYFVANLEEQLHRQIRALGCHDRFVQIVSLAAEKALHALRGGLVEFSYLTHRVLEDGPESAGVLRAAVELRRLDRAPGSNSRDGKRHRLSQKIDR